MGDGLVDHAGCILRKCDQVSLTIGSHQEATSTNHRVYRSWVESVAGMFKGKMLLDMVGVIIQDYGFLWEEYYFPSATL